MDPTRTTATTAILAALLLSGCLSSALAPLDATRILVVVENGGNADSHVNLTLGGPGGDELLHAAVLVPGPGHLERAANVTVAGGYSVALHLSATHHHQRYHDTLTGLVNPADCPPPSVLHVTFWYQVWDGPDRQVVYGPSWDVRCTR